MTVSRRPAGPLAAVVEPAVTRARRLAPGIGLALGVAAAAALAEPLVARGIAAATGQAVQVPAIVIALIIGMALHGLSRHAAVEPGLSWCVKSLLRIAVALLGLRIAVGDILALGLSTAALVVATMAATLLAGLLLARVLGVGEGYGAMAGAATAVCGASAALATASAVPAYPGKSTDLVFTVMAANAVSTLAMIAYPALCVWAGLDDRATAVVLGATIHDMAQVVGAGYAVSEEVGATAVVVKLFRVFLLLPVVLAVGWWLARSGGEAGQARVPVPVFAFAFLALSGVNSLVPLLPPLVPAFAAVKTVLTGVSAYGFLIAIAALGLGTSVTTLFRIGWRHLAVFLAATLLLLLLALAGVTLLG